MARPLLRLVTTTKERAAARRSQVVLDDGSADESAIDAGEKERHDAQLLAALHAGDEDAAAELHDRLRPRVDLTIRSLLGPGHSEHDDLAQQSFIEIVLSLERYRGECSLETWAATISARTVFKFLRRRTTERKIFRDPGGLGGSDGSSRRDNDAPESGKSSRTPPSSRASFGSHPSSTTGFGRQMVARELAERIRAHLDGMDQAKAEAFLLHDVCGFDAHEVAGIAGISEAAAHARIARGRRELHAKLAADPDLRDALVDLEVEP